MSLQELARKIEKCFSEDEVKTELCFEMNINYSDLSGSNRKSKIIELVLLCERHDRLADLVKICEKQRLGESWPTSLRLPSKSETQNQENKNEEEPIRKGNRTKSPKEIIENDINRFAFDDGSLIKVIKNSSKESKKLIEDELTKIRLLTRSRPFEEPYTLNIENMSTLNFIEELRIDPRIIVIGNIPENKNVSEIKGVRNPLLNKIEISYRPKSQYPNITIRGYSTTNDGNDIQALFRERSIQSEDPKSDIEFRSKDKIGKIITRLDKFQLKGEFITLQIPQSSTLSVISTSVIDISNNKDKLILRIIKIFGST